MCLSFFLSCAWLPPPPIHRVAVLTSSLCSADFLVICFYGSRFCSPAINQTSLSQSKGWFPLLPARVMNCADYQLFLCTGAINMSQLRTTYHPTHTDHYALKKTRTTTTTFLISNRVVPNPYNHSTAFEPQSIASLS